jgi:SAM-dependent methyltransferase
VDAPSLTALAAAVLRIAAPPERVLAIESGEGEPALFLAREFPAARVRGVGSAPDRVRAATARVGLDPEGRIAFKVGRRRALPYPGEFFDLVVQVDGRPAVAEIARVLRPQGYLVLARSEGRGATDGPGAWLLRRRLRRHGIEPVESAAAGDGSFSVARRRDAGQAKLAD